MRVLKKNTTTPATPPPPAPSPTEEPTEVDNTTVDDSGGGDSSNGRESMEINCTEYENLTPFEKQTCDDGFLWVRFNQDAA